MLHIHGVVSTPPPPAAHSTPVPALVLKGGRGMGIRASNATHIKRANIRLSQRASEIFAYGQICRPAMVQRKGPLLRPALSLVPQNPNISRRGTTSESAFDIGPSDHLDRSSSFTHRHTHTLSPSRRGPVRRRTCNSVGDIPPLSLLSSRNLSYTVVLGQSYLVTQASRREASILVTGSGASLDSPTSGSRPRARGPVRTRSCTPRSRLCRSATRYLSRDPGPPTSQTLSGQVSVLPTYLARPCLDELLRFGYHPKPLQDL